MRSTTYFIIGLAFAWQTGAASAQAGASGYARSAADTLRYREQTRTRIELQSPQGVVPIDATHDAVIALRFAAGDTAFGWYESLSVGVSAQNAHREPATSEVLGKAFTLRFPADGRVETLATPAFPASLEGVADLSRQFFDFFLALPAQPLRPGLEWSDTLEVNDRQPSGGEYHVRKIGRYRVVGDTVIDGARALVISASMSQTLRSTVPGPSAGVTARTTLAGEDGGRFYFSVESGRMLGRERRGRLSGKLEYLGGPTAAALNQVFTYQSTIRLLR